MENYIPGAVIGSGQYGTVRKGLVRHTGVPVAIKQIRVGRTTEGIPHPVARELLIVSRLDHPFVVKVVDVFPHYSCMVIVMERCKMDLGAFLRQFSICTPLDLSSVRHLLKMLLTALAYVHKMGILHRDVKPANCFLTGNGVLKLGDFGLSRFKADDMSHEVVSRWYRAPELLFGRRSYGAEIDIWSAGCIFAELLRGAPGPLFSGDGDLNQLSKIFDVLGTPSGEAVSIYEELPDWDKVHFDAKTGCGLTQLFPFSPATALDLLSSMLSLNPRTRVSAVDALRHSFFDEV
ncbi:protein kinase [Strigomonas culicis]|uniref:[RNA-polymerase]-subunit kinase n=1 Tax=Strigomonas culicis TaxID=28005 RepID=S9VEK1_9TRYP|nr:protein kinase [Strigomonas culicis]|eukprot:EPY25526.1 protein kinase [Strigomonas culicis]